MGSVVGVSWKGSGVGVSWSGVWGQVGVVGFGFPVQYQESLLCVRLFRGENCRQGRTLELLTRESLLFPSLPPLSYQQQHP